MVLTTRIGTPRSFPLVVLLYAATFGIYGNYWNYKAHAEVFRQFELHGEGKDEGMVWLVLGLSPFRPLIWVYQWTFVSNVQHVRERLGFSRSLTAAGFLGRSIPGSILAGLGVFLAYLGLLMAADPAAFTDSLEDEQSLADLGRSLAVAGAGTAVVGAALLLTAYGRLQRSINEIWTAYDRRMSELTAPAWNPA